ncbi:hypothetical protein FEM48_Zijuj01G0329500 [Ziziphus jujuba var. spinosa]|uniref:Replication protein A 70 kDa DNA-binding subunit B-like n=1 Tax=Ziziphus jujuba var. spinosa TaxID=714518 RepID=A0A978W6N9_ZIZJJ|nr:hypothetical protein FEM48_Zijuj01G0329500 [Ziziphus jujuba var. spinosa]
MVREVKLIKDIQAQQRGWTVKVVVIEKAMPQVSKSSPNKYQRLILADEEGNKIQATIYGGDIHIFRDTLIIGKNYYISNAWVKEIGAQYQIVQNNLQWTINGRTIVEEVTGDSEIIVPAVYSFVLFSRLHTYIDSLSHVDVIGIAIEIKPKKEIITNDGLEIVQEMTLMNDNMDTVMLTMWNQFVNNECTQILNIMNRKPIIIGCRLKVSSYNGISLSTKSSSSFVIEPEIPQAAALSIWIGFETKSLSTLPSIEDIITIKMIDNQLNTRRSFWINGHIKVTNLIQPFWYLSCEKCTKATGYEFEQRFNCLYCRHDQVKAMPRCLVIVDLINESSSLNATLFGNQAEKFLGCTAYELMNKSDGDSVKDIEKIATLSSSHKLLIQVKASKHEYRDITRWKYTILSVCDTISKEINTLTQTDTSNDAEVSQVLEIIEEQSGKSLGITELREQMSNEDKVLADLVSKPTARNNATKKLKLMISKSADFMLF